MGVNELTTGGDEWRAVSLGSGVNLGVMGCCVAFFDARLPIIGVEYSLVSRLIARSGSMKVVCILSQGDSIV